MFSVEMNALVIAMTWWLWLSEGALGQQACETILSLVSSKCACLCMPKDLRSPDQLVQILYS